MKSGQVLYSCRTAIQTVVIMSLLKMHKIGRRKSLVGQNSWRGLRQAFRCTITCLQSSSARLLLANPASNDQWNCLTLRHVPTICLSTPSPCKCDNSDQLFSTLRTVGNKHFRTFSKGPSTIKVVIVSIDYFTKWVEAKLVAKISNQQTRSFVLKNMICCFGIPLALVADNGMQFTRKNFWDFCEGHNITLKFTAMTHPQTNDQVEVTNRSILHTLRTQLEKVAGLWANYISKVLWSYRTTICTTTEESPFFLAFGSKVVIPTGLSVPSYKLLQYDLVVNDEDNCGSKNLLEEVHLQV